MIESNVTIQELLTEGSRTTIYRGTFGKESPSPVIIKLLHPSPVFHSAESLLAHEHQFSNILASAGIRKSYGVVQIPEGTALILEYIPGPPLSRYMTGKKLDLPAFFPLALSMANELHAVHSCGIFHKDIHPGNFIVTGTGQSVRLIDFGMSEPICSVHTLPEIEDRASLAFPYMSPEQTGRMNRALDYRTDFYSLGIVFYEMLAGTLPLTASDPLGWAFAHMTKAPVPLHEYDASIPEVLSAMIMKMMAKNPEERYRSAACIVSYLEAIYEEWRRTGAVRTVIPPVDDVPGQLRLLQPLFGKSAAWERLSDSYDRIEAGGSGLAAITGSAGVGKTELMERFRSAVLQRGGRFLSGRFDHNKKQVPYEGIRLAIRQWFDSLLLAGEDEIRFWERTMAEVLDGHAAALMIETFSDSAWLFTGAAASGDSIAISKEELYFKAFRCFVSAIVQHGPALVLWLDDFHLADPGSVRMLQRLLTDDMPGKLLLVFACREDAVSPCAPLAHVMHAAETEETYVCRIALSDWTESQLLQYVSGALDMSAEACLPLAGAVFRKTLGNPFFAGQFLQRIVQEALLRYDRQARQWQWDTERILKLEFTENVTESVIRNLTSLSPELQRLLHAAAALGTSFDPNVLAAVCALAEEEASSRIWPAVQAGLLVKSTEGYAFANGRIQEAAYRLADPERTVSVHAKIAKVLKEAADEAAEYRGDNRIFEIAHHLECASAYIENSGTAVREEALLIFAEAGFKASKTAAYETAVNLLHRAKSLMGDDEWTQRYDVAVALEKELAECLFWIGRHEEAKNGLEALLPHLRSPEETADIYVLLVRMCTSLGQFQEAVRIASIGLGMFGIDLHDQDVEAQINVELAKAGSFMNGREIPELLALPAMTDRQMLKVLMLYACILTSLYMINMRLYTLVSLRIVNLSMQYGNQAESSAGYITYAVVLARLGAYEQAYAYGRLAIGVADTYRNNRLACTSRFMLGASLSHWVSPVEESVEALDQAYREGQACGNLLYATYAAVVRCAIDYYRGVPLEKLQETIDARYSFVQRTKNSTIHLIDSFRRMSDKLQAGTPDAPILGSSPEEELAFAEQLARSPEKMSLRYYASLKMTLQYLFGNYTEARKLAATCNELRNAGVVAEYWITAEDVFIQGLTNAALYDAADQADQPALLTELNAQSAQLKRWAGHNPSNFLHKAELLEAEQARIRGDRAEAERLYHQSAESARAAGNWKDFAISTECAGAHYERAGLRLVAKMYFTEAHKAYLMWGAAAKAASLAKRYPEWLTPGGRMPASAATTLSSLELFDSATIVKACQSMSEEIQLDRMLNKLLTVVFEHAGAENGFLAIRQDGKWIVAAEGELHEQSVRIAHPMEPIDRSDRPEAIFYYVARSKKSIILDDACQAGLFTQDEYIVRCGIRSVICLPVLKQGQLIAVLYLENNRMTHAFSARHLEMLGLLSAQMAISIENASLYASLEDKVRVRTQELQQLNVQLEASEVRYRTIFENTGTAMLIVAEDGRISLANTEFARIMETELSELVGRRWTDFIFEEDINIVAQKRALRLQVTTSAQRHSYEVRAVTAAGRLCDFWMTVSTIVGTTDVVVSILDITERKRAENLVRNMAYLDALTGLPNRKMFEEALIREIDHISSGSDSKLAVMFLDMDGFKQVNDTYGHRIGDQLLCEVASRLRSALPEKHLVSRLGGDEFTLLLTGVKDKDEVRLLAERIFEAFRPVCRMGDIEISISSSIGISMCPNDGHDSESLVKQADAAMYQAKQQGKNRYSFYSRQ
ncbi:diguanylate cyclase domain-containing protein [Paenibacillus chartarius]|uniref:Diguanylate cyclase domain-containing protein n=1 Tax=Paenibacillus chartarius TaxID=747481 RepID=A0ABV6DVP4_9BACL